MNSFWNSLPVYLAYDIINVFILEFVYNNEQLMNYVRDLLFLLVLLIEK